MLPSGHSGLPYRADIDGLRAIAVLSVIFFHAGFAWAQGGFIGVDVFFVISGYLITGILRREFAAGRFSLMRFYERRARRILPALLVVLAATMGAAAILMLPADTRVVARSAVSVLAFAANFMFWRGIDFGDITTVNYFGRRIHEQPLVHTWSLGVEEQYYLLFPIALWLIWKLRPSIAGPALMAGAAASLALCIWLTPGRPALAFYLLPTRGWQLLAGGLMSWLDTRPIERRPMVKEGASWLGLALVLVPTWLYSAATPFPGYAALMPVAGAALLLRCGDGTTAAALLSRRPIVFIGLISYSAYLWHQPLFALTRYLALSGELETRAAIVLIAVTIALAAATWRWIETPFRDRRVVAARTVWLSAAAGCFVVAIPAAQLAFGGDAGLRTPIASNIAGQAFMSLIADCGISSPLRTRPGCVLDPSRDAAPQFLVVGDSHSEALFPAFARISRNAGVQGLLLQHIACSPLLEAAGPPSSTPDCLTMRQLAFDLIDQHHIRSVFLVSRFSKAYAPMNLFAARLERTIDAYADRGVLVHLVMQAPEQPRFRARHFLHAMLRERFLGVDASPVIAAMAISPVEHAAQQAFVRGVFDRYRGDPRVRIVDFTPRLCGAALCAVGTAAGPYYNDEDHLPAAAALLVSADIARQSVLSGSEPR
jgi:peptidoglycan/LPS O-acetylase OafA/YrhL